jgi:hypothetical protein
MSRERPGRGDFRVGKAGLRRHRPAAVYDRTFPRTLENAYPCCDFAPLSDVSHFVVELLFVHLRLSWLDALDFDAFAFSRDYDFRLGRRQEPAMQTCFAGFA